MGKSKAAAPTLPGTFHQLLPVEPACDHEMQDEEEIAVEFEDDAFAEPTQTADGLAEHGVDGRIVGAEQEGIGEPDLHERLADDARAEGVDVGDDVGKFGHGVTGEDDRKVASVAAPTSWD